MSERRKFGARVSGIRYSTRRCVYGVAVDERGRVLVVRHEGRLVLPGGCVDPGELDGEVLARKVVEETGYRVDVGAAIARARQLVSRVEHGTARDEDCGFFHIDVTAAVGEPTEPGHEPTWSTVEDALDELEYGSHRWAVSQAADD